MGDARRWIVTYTRHLKQKRKVYQDGALELHFSSNKLVLYDDSGKILDRRFLGKDEVIELGGMLAFDSHLVDIGEIEKNCKQLTEINVQGSDDTVTKRISVPVRKARHSSSSEHEIVKLRNVGASVKHQNITHNDARVNKKGQLQESGVTQSTVRGNKQAELHNNGELPKLCKCHADEDVGSEKWKIVASCTRLEGMLKSAVVEGWHALYTTQITQKAKKYHDGILRLSLCGSHGKQVMLYDDSRKLLDSRFLKKDETVESGCTLAFVARLVEIGEPEEPHTPLKDLNFQERDVKSNEETLMEAQSYRKGLSAENKKTKLQQNGQAQTSLVAAKNSVKNQSQENEASNSHPNITDNSVTEWHALYTSQLIQKAKKYDDGILQLSNHGSYGKQVTLFSEDGRILGSKYIRSSEEVRTGAVFELPNYLVDIGGQRTSLGGNLHHEISSVPVVSKSSIPNPNGFSVSEKATGHKILRDGLSGSILISGFKTSNAWKSLGANQILSIIKKPSSEESLDHTERVIKQACCMHSTNFVESYIQGNLPEQNLYGLEDPKPNAAGGTGRDDVGNPEEDNTSETGTSRSGRNFPNITATQDVLSPEFTNSMDHGHGQKPAQEGSAIIESESCTAVIHISEADYLAGSINAPQVSVIITSDLLEDGQIQPTKLSTSSNGMYRGNIAPIGLSDCLKDDELVWESFRFMKWESNHPDEGSITDASSRIPADMEVSSKSGHIALQILEKAKHACEKQVCAGDAAVDDQILNGTLSSVSSVNISGVADDQSNGLKEKSNKIPSFDLGI